MYQRNSPRNKSHSRITPKRKWKITCRSDRERHLFARVHMQGVCPIDIALPLNSQINYHNFPRKHIKIITYSQNKRKYFILDTKIILIKS